MGNKFKWDMFVTSFLPLWISIFVINIWNICANALDNWNGKISVCANVIDVLVNNVTEFVVLVFICIIAINGMCSISNFLKRQNATNNKQTAKIIRAKKANKLSAEFLLTYILPMIAFDFSKLQDITLFVIYFIVLAILCVRNNNVYTNIYLEFKGYKMYECDMECAILNKKHVYTDSLVISSKDLTVEIGNSIKYWDFENYIYINLKDVDEKQ